MKASDRGRNVKSKELFGCFDEFCISMARILFCSLAVLDPRVGHTMDVLSPFIPVLCHSDWLFHGESCPRLDVVQPGRAWSSLMQFVTLWLELLRSRTITKSTKAQQTSQNYVRKRMAKKNVLRRWRKTGRDGDDWMSDGNELQRSDGCSDWKCASTTDGCERKFWNKQVLCSLSVQLVWMATACDCWSKMKWNRWRRAKSATTGQVSDTSKINKQINK